MIQRKLTQPQTIRCICPQIAAKDNPQTARDLARTCKALQAAVWLTVDRARLMVATQQHWPAHVNICALKVVQIICYDGADLVEQLDWLLHKLAACPKV